MNINKSEVGKRVFSIRKSLGLTMKEFGERMGNPVASDSIVSRWEKGISLPNNERLKKIAELGKISVDELLYGSLDEYAKLLLNQLQDKLEEDESINDIFVKPIMNQAINYLNPIRDYVPLEERFKNKKHLKTKFDTYIDSIIDGFKNIETREKNIIANLQNTIYEDFEDAITLMYADNYKDDNTFLILGIEEGMSEELYNELILLQNEIYKKLDLLIEKYTN